MMARASSLSEWTSTPIRFLLKIISRTKRRHVDAISCVQSASVPIHQVAQGTSPISSTPSTVDHKPTPANDYYQSHEATDGFCLFNVQGSLFKVHRFVLARDSSAFESMFKLPSIPVSVNSRGKAADEPVPLTDTAEQFQDLLWGLYALPSDLQLAELPFNNHATSVREQECKQQIPLTRVLNIAEMAHKYGFPSFESWALSYISTQAMDPSGPLQIAPLDICARMLDITMLTGHQTLSELIVEALVSRLLDFTAPPETHIALWSLLSVAGVHGISKLTGAALYHHLIMSEKSLSQKPAQSQPRSESQNTPNILDTPVITRTSYLSAFHSLVNAWAHIRSNPPVITCGDGDGHDACTSLWRSIWTDAAFAAEQMETSCADVVSRLRHMDRVLRRSLLTHPSISLECALAALEGYMNLRDGFISNLSNIFETAH